MRIPLSDIKTFSKCPAFYHFSKKAKEPPTPKRARIISEVIKRAYMKHTETGYLVDWRNILGWIDKATFIDIDLNDDDAVDAARAFSESIVVPVRHWYDKVYKYEKFEGFINIPLERTAGGHQIYTMAPIIKLSDPPTLVYIDDVVSSEVQMYNDIAVRGLVWLAAGALDREDFQAQHLLIGPSRALEITTIRGNKEVNRRAEQAILHIADAIAAGVNYPSITSMCNQCQFRKECLL